MAIINPFFRTDYNPQEKKESIDEDIIVTEIIENVTYDTEKHQKIVTYEEKKTNLTKKINETAKLLKERNAEIFEKLSKMMEE